MVPIFGKFANQLQLICLSCCYEFFLKTSSTSLVQPSIESLLVRSLNFGIIASMAERYIRKEKPRKQNDRACTDSKNNFWLITALNRVSWYIWQQTMSLLISQSSNDFLDCFSKFYPSKVRVRKGPIRRSAVYLFLLTRKLANHIHSFWLIQIEWMWLVEDF